MTKMCQDLVILQEHNVSAGFTTRPSIGWERRNELAEALGSKGGALVQLGLVHGIRVVRVDPQDLAQNPGEILYLDGIDGAVTDLKNVALTSGHGDCLPVYFYDPSRAAIGLVHAGWRGTLGNIAREAVRSMSEFFSCDPAGLHVWIGPGIGRCCFEVSQDVAESFREAFVWAGEYIDAMPEKKYHIDLKGINRRQLNECGVGTVRTSDLCTVCRDDLFYSHRRSKDRERMLAYIYLKGDH